MWPRFDTSRQFYRLPPRPISAVDNLLAYALGAFYQVALTAGDAPD